MKENEQAAPAVEQPAKDSSGRGDEIPKEQADYHGEGKALIDKKIRKKFGKRMTSGDVEDFNPETKLYKVRFADDSTEQIAWPELKNLLPQEPKRFPRRKKEANPEVAPDAKEVNKDVAPDEAAHLEKVPERAHLETTEKSGEEKLPDGQTLEESKPSAQAAADDNVSEAAVNEEESTEEKLKAADEQVEAADTGTEPNQEIKAVGTQEENPAAETEKEPPEEVKLAAELETVHTEEESGANTGSVQETIQEIEIAAEVLPEEAPNQPAVPDEAGKGSQQNEKAPEDTDVEVQQNTSNNEAEKEVETGEAQKEQADSVVPMEAEEDKPTKASQQGADGKDGAEKTVDKDGATGEEEKEDNSEDEISDSDLERELQARKKPKKRKANVLTLKRWRGYKKKRKERAALQSDANNKSAEGEAKDVTVDAVEEAMPRRESRTRKLSEVEASPEAIKRQKLADIAKQKKSEIKSMLRGSPALAPPATPKSDQDKAVEENHAEQNIFETAIKVPDEPKDVVPSAPTDAGAPDEAKPSPFDRGIKLRGRKLRKNLNGILCRGEIADYDRRTRHYKIRYENGVEEKLMWKEAGHLLVSWEEQATWDSPDSEPKVMEIDGQEIVPFENRQSKPKLPKLTPLVRKRNR